jgi:hypothetical protein
MKKRQTWLESLKQWAFRSVVSAVVFTLTVAGLGTVLIYAATTLP